MQPTEERPKWRRQLFFFLRLAGAILLLAWVGIRLRKQGFSLESLGAMELSSSWLLAAVGLGVVSVLAWAGRWWCFLRIYRVKAGYGELLRLTFFADFFNLYFLGPLGADGIRLLLLGRRFPDQRGAIVGSLMLDHVGGMFGGAALYFLFIHEAPLPENVARVAHTALIVWVGITILGVGVLMEPWLQRLLGRIPGLRRLSARVAPLYAGAFRQPWLLAGIGVSALGTACAYAAYWAAAQALGMDLLLVEMLGLMPVVDTVASLPVTLSGIGIREGLLVEWLGADPDIGPAGALAVSLLGFAALGLWGLVGGLWLAFWRKGQTTA